MESHTHMFKNTNDYLQFMTDLDIKAWTPKYLRCAISAKKANRKKKGMIFNCFVLVRPTVEREESSDEFLQFLDYLQLNLPFIKKDLRFNLAVCNAHSMHWTAFDCLIEDGVFYVNCIDAADDSSADASFEAIRKRFPKAQAKILKPDRNPLDRTKLRIIQTDSTNCAMMTLEHIFMLSKRDFLRFPEIGMRISPTDLFKKAPELYRVTQSLLTLESFKKDETLIEALMQPVSKKKLTLFEYYSRNFDDGKNKKNEIVTQNQTIQVKKVGLIKAMDAFISNLSADEASKIFNANSLWETYINSACVKNLTLSEKF